MFLQPEILLVVTAGMLELKVSIPTIGPAQPIFCSALPRTYASMLPYGVSDSSFLSGFGMQSW